MTLHTLHTGGLNPSLPMFPRGLSAEIIERIVDHAAAAVRPLSRTMQGISAASAGRMSDNPAAEPAELAQIATRNFKRALRVLLEVDPEPLRPEEAEMLVHETATLVNLGLVGSHRPLLRAWKSDLPSQPDPEFLPGRFSEFCAELARTMRSGAPPAARAAWIERRLDYEDRLLNDGCGRVAKTLASWMLGRSGLSYPEFESYGVYRSLLTDPDPAVWTSAYTARTGELRSTR